MKYISTYKIGKEIHVLDCTKLADIAAGCTRLYRGKGVHIELKGDWDGDIRTKEMLSLLSASTLFKPTYEIEVIVSGDLSKQKLKGIADAVGRVFSED